MQEMRVLDRPDAYRLIANSTTPVADVPAVQVTMSSVEIVKVINGVRKQEAEAAGANFGDSGLAKLKHSDFMKKVRLEIGEYHAGRFSGMVKVAIGSGAMRDSKCYYLPEREANLMVMSESPTARAAVYDRMVELGMALKKPLSRPPRPPRHP